MGTPEPRPAEQEPFLDPGVEPPAGVRPTGDPAVDAVLDQLLPIPDLALSQQADAYDRFHDELLTELNEEHS